MLIAMLRSSLWGSVQGRTYFELPDSKLMLREVIDIVQQQSTYNFSFGSKVPLSCEIRFNARRLTLEQLLTTIERSCGVRHEIRGSKILLVPPQRRSTVSGYIRDARTGENLIGASVYVMPGQQGTLSNSYGFFSVTLPDDSVELVISYIGYNTEVMRFRLSGDTILSANLMGQVLDEVVITAKEELPDITQMSSIDLSVDKIKTTPTLAGETDAMKVLQLLPGVQGGNEGSSGLYVRGGGPDQNLILLDGVPVYNASHLFGFVSVFNADAINHVELIKGGFPARFGGRLSSVIDIAMKEGNREEVKGEGSVGLVSSRLTIEGPIRKGKSSFIVSGRRTYADLIARPLIKKSTGGDVFGYYFYDLNAKFNHVFNDRSRIYFSTYTGTDRGYSRTSGGHTEAHTGVRVSHDDRANLWWGNVTSAFRWNYMITPRLFSNVTATYSRYRMNADARNVDHFEYPNGELDEARSQIISTRYYSGIEDYSVKVDHEYIPSPRHYLRYGAYGTFHKFSPGATTLLSDERAQEFDSGLIPATEYGAYVEDDFTLGMHWRVNVGVHSSGFQVEDRLSTSVQPRMSVRYKANERIAIKGSYARMVQYIHLLTNSGLGLPTDLWVPPTSMIKPQLADQVALGLAYTPNPTYEITLENYYKTMDGVIEYRDGASFLNTSEDWQSKVAVGNGLSYGSELFIQKKKGTWNGWLGYTLSRTYRQFDELNQGRRFPYRYDRTHDVEFVVNRQFGTNRTLSLVWVYGTGNATTIPTAVYGGWPRGENYWDYTPITHYEARNNYRMACRSPPRCLVHLAETKTMGRTRLGDWIIQCL